MKGASQKKTVPGAKKSAVRRALLGDRLAGVESVTYFVAITTHQQDWKLVHDFFRILRAEFRIMVAGFIATKRIRRYVAKQKPVRIPCIRFAEVKENCEVASYLPGYVRTEGGVVVIKHGLKNHNNSGLAILFITIQPSAIAL